MSIKFVDQTTFYDPNIPGLGNCTEACVASLLGIQLEEVPNFWPEYIKSNYPALEYEFGVEKFWSNFYEFFESRGLVAIRFDRGEVFDDVIHLACGPSSRGCAHSVLMKGIDVIHDPHPSREGILRVECSWLAVPKELARWQNV